MVSLEKPLTFYHYCITFNMRSHLIPSFKPYRRDFQILYEIL